MGARALLAFRRGDPDSDQALLGALMESEFQAWVVQFIKAYLEAMSRVKK